MLVSAFLAAAALAQSIGSATGFAHTALLYVEPDSATLAVIDTSDGSIADVQREPLPDDDDAAVAKLVGLVSGAEALETGPQGVLVVGSGVDIPLIKPALEAATSLPLNVPEQPEIALARGAGFRREGILTFILDTKEKSDNPHRQGVEADLLQRIGHLPGVASTSAVQILFISGGGWNGSVHVEGYTPAADEELIADFNAVAPNFFATMTIRPPKIVDRPHRHSSAAINYYFHGSGRSTVEGKVYRWKAGDLMLSAPGWAVHNHASDDDYVYELTVQDQPLNIAMESLLWQESLKLPMAVLGVEEGLGTNRAAE